jgi:hypothetical protein
LRSSIHFIAHPQACLITALIVGSIDSTTPKRHGVVAAGGRSLLRDAVRPLEVSTSHQILRGTDRFRCELRQHPEPCGIEAQFPPK